MDGGQSARKLIGMTVCSGIGVAELAAPWIDWRWQSEIDPAACRVLAHRFPDAVNLGDMTKFKEWPDATVDVLAGGTPCQSFSVAGLRKGLDDPRGNLMLTYLAIASRYRPRWLVWENVAGVLSSSGGRDFGAFLGGLGELGYGFSYRVLDAQFARTHRHPRAVPQRRRRVFVVGYLGDWRCAAAVLFDAESLRGNPPPRREARERVARPIGAGSPRGSGYRLDADTAENLTPEVAGTLSPGAHPGGFNGQDAYDGKLIAQPFAPAVTSNPYGDHESREGLLVADTLRGDGFDASEDGTGRGTPLVPITIMQRGREGGPSIEWRQDGTSNAILTPNGGRAGMGVGAVCVPIAFTSKDHGADAMQDCAPTLRAGGHTDSHANAGVPPAVVWPINTQIATRHEALGRGTGFGIGEPGDPAFTLQAGHHHAVATQWAVRRLLPIECERLQGLLDGFTDIPGAKPMADGPRYKMIGNAWAMNAGEAVFEGIRRVEALQEELAA